jgi:hypothetical protein
VTEPSSASFFGVSVGWNSSLAPIVLPGVPFSIRLLATRTVTGALASLTLLRYWFRYASRMIPASSAAAALNAIVPPLVDSIFCANSMLISPLLG